MTSKDKAEQIKPEDETKTEKAQADTSIEDGAEENSQAEADAEISDQVEDDESAADDDEPLSPEEERDQLKDQLLRAIANHENLRKRTEREVSAAKKYGPLAFARDLLVSLDNLEKAIDLIPENKDEMDETLKNILVGVEMTGREMAAAFERHGIKRINPVDEKFDYNMHQAMFEVPTDEVEPGTVVQVVQTGYSLHDRLLRPAMVGVSKPTEDKPESASK